MLTFPAVQDRLVVLASGLILIAGLAYIVNRMRLRSEKRRSGA